MKTYYKVVSYNPIIKQYVSIINVFSNHYELAHKFGVEYKIGQWTTPIVDGTSLMCFRDLYSAEIFKTQLDRTELKIFKCYAKGVHRNYKLFYPLYVHQNIANKVDFFLEQKKKKKRITNTVFDQVPYGTVFCKKIMLLEEV